MSIPKGTGYILSQSSIAAPLDPASVYIYDLPFVSGEWLPGYGSNTSAYDAIFSQALVLGADDTSVNLGGSLPAGATGVTGYPQYYWDLGGGDSAIVTYNGEYSASNYSNSLFFKGVSDSVYTKFADVNNISHYSYSPGSFGGASGSPIDQSSSTLYWQISPRDGDPNPIGYIAFTFGAAEAICFLSDTPVLMADGSEKAIRDVASGDLVQTLAGAKPVRWVGVRRIPRQLYSLPGFEMHLPVMFQKDSISDGVPSKDICVSPRHSVVIDGGICFARVLVNGVSIRQLTPHELNGDLHYCHLELQEESVILTSGMKSCSYVDVANRRLFDNYYDHISRFACCFRRSTPIHVGRRDVYSIPGKAHRLKRAMERVAAWR